MKKVKKNNKIIFSVVFLVFIFFVIFGLSYAYFLTKVYGNNNDKSVSIQTGDLELVYKDGNGLIEADNLIPGQNISEKTFSVTNDGDVVIYNYNIKLEDVVNTLSRTSDLVYTLSCTSSVSGKICNNVSSETVFPSEDKVILTNNISPDEVQTYSLKVVYKDVDEDQSVDMKKEISAKVNIGEANTTANSLYNTLLYVNGTPTATRSNFNKIYTENTASDHGFYKTTENGTDIYYFAGTEKDQDGCYGVDTGKYYEGVTKSQCSNYQGYYCSLYIGEINNETECIEAKSGVSAWISEETKWYQKATINNWVKFGKYEEDTYLLYNSTAGTSTISSTNCNPDTNENCIKLASAGDDMYWRIIRTDEDGNVKLLYSGTSVNDTHAYIDYSPYSTDKKNISYKSSTVKNVIDNWVIKNLSDYFDQISTTANYCNEVTKTDVTLTGTNGTVFNTYSAYNRFGTSTLSAKDSISPTLDCSGENIVSNLYAALVTTDELSYAGGSPGKESTNVWYYRNAIGESNAQNVLWFTMTPHSYLSTSRNFISLVYGGGRLPSDFLNIDNNISGENHYPKRAVRPVVTLNSNAKVLSGDGSSTNPYVISDSDNNKICYPISVNTSGSYTIGDEYSCLVDPDHTPYNFYVIGTTNDSVTMMMDSNICSNGQANDGTLKCTISWTDGDTYSKGPNTALTYLETATSGWKNLQNINVVHSDESTASTKSPDIEFTGKARFLYKSEFTQLYNLGKLDLLRNNLTSTIPRYYLADTIYNANKNLYNVLTIDYTNANVYVGSLISNSGSIGVRPVISVLKYRISN